MAFDARWVPARWRGKEPPAGLRGSPVNCLVVEWPQGREAALQAKQAGFAVVGDLAGAQDAPAAAASAREAGLDAAIGPPELADDFVLPGAPLGGLPRSGRWAAAVIRECVWPAIRLGNRNDSASAGPTGVPWIDSNGWAARLAGTLNPAQAVWLDFGPPEGTVVTPEDWVRAAAEAWAHGARWMLPPGALEAPVWQALRPALEFFERSRGWPRETASPVGAISDFHVDNEFLSHEFLNLTARRQLPVRILERSRAASLPWDGLRVLVYLDRQPPEGALLERLARAVRDGALLIAPPDCAPLFQGAPAGEAPAPGYRVTALGKGRAAIAAEAWEDPFLLAVDVQNLMGRREAPLRLWNGGNVIPHPTGASGDRPAVIHLVNYSTRANDVTLGLPGRHRAAAFYTPESAAPLPLKAQVVRLGVELHLPPFHVYGAVMLEG